MIEYTNPTDDLDVRVAPAASLASISIPVRRQVQRRAREGAKAAAMAKPTPVSPPLPTNDDEPVVPPKRFPSAHSTADTGPAFDDEWPGARSPYIPAYQEAPVVAPAALIDLWEHLAASRLRPKVSDLDPVTIARQWPNSLLLRVTENGRRPTLEVAHMFVPSAGGSTSPIPIDAMTVDWIVGLSREVVSSRVPVHETDDVPTAKGTTPCGVIALPFGPDARVDHVLCHLYRVDDSLIEAADPAVFRRMTPRERPGIRRIFGR